MGAVGPYGKVDHRLHHEDGTHRSTPRTANGSEVDWFDGALERHLAAHKEQEE